MHRWEELIQGFQTVYYFTHKALYFLFYGVNTYVWSFGCSLFVASFPDFY